MLQKWLITETDVLTSWRYADMNQDSRVNAADLTLLKRMLLNPST